MSNRDLTAHKFHFKETVNFVMVFRGVLLTEVLLVFKEYFSDKSGNNSRTMF